MRYVHIHGLALGHQVSGRILLLQVCAQNLDSPQAYSQPLLGNIPDSSFRRYPTALNRCQVSEYSLALWLCGSHHSFQRPLDKYYFSCCAD